MHRERGIDTALRLDRKPELSLLNRTANLREHVVGVRSDEPDGAHYNDENYSQHDCIFCNVLTTLIFPEVQ
jgi:hypothetical protein